MAGHDAHMGPIPLGPSGGTLTSENKEFIKNRTGVAASVRYRQQWGQRCLTLSGPPGQMQIAMTMARECIEANGTEGGRVQEPEQELQWRQQPKGKGHQHQTASQASSSAGISAQDFAVFRQTYEQQVLYLTGQIQYLQQKLTLVESTASNALQVAAVAQQQAMANEQQFKRQRKAHKKQRQSEENKSPQSSEEATEEVKPEAESQAARRPSRSSAKSPPAAAKKDIKDEQFSDEESSSSSKDTKVSERTKVVSPTSPAEKEHFIIVENLTKDCSFSFPEARPGFSCFL